MQDMSNKIDKSTSPVVQSAIDTAKGSQKPLTGSPQAMINALPTKHPLTTNQYKGK